MSDDDIKLRKDTCDRLIAFPVNALNKKNMHAHTHMIINDIGLRRDNRCRNTLLPSLFINEKTHIIQLRYTIAQWLAMKIHLIYRTFYECVSLNHLFN